MKNLFAFIFIILCSQLQVLAEEAPIDPAFLPQNCVFSASFRQKQSMAGLPKALESSGKLFFNCESGLIWQQESPTADTYIYTHSHQVFHLSSEGKLQAVSGKLEKNLAKLLTGLMGGNTRYLNRYFKAKSSSATQLELLPKKKRIAKFIARISINKKEQAKEIFWENSIGNSTLLEIHAEEIYPDFSEEQCSKAINNHKNICHILSNAS